MRQERQGVVPDAGEVVVQVAGLALAPERRMKLLRPSLQQIALLDRSTVRVVAVVESSLQVCNARGVGLTLGRPETTILPAVSAR